MTSFLVETYEPGGAAVAAIEARARSAAHGTAVHYRRSIFVPADEVCFHLLDGPSADAVGDVVRRAGISPQRILEVRR
jgi:hypothetical protein